MGGDIERAQRLPARRVQGAELISAGEPDLLAVKGDPVHGVDAGKGTIFASDLGF
jgi:hypothetical protein